MTRSTHSHELAFTLCAQTKFSSEYRYNFVRQHLHWEKCTGKMMPTMAMRMIKFPQDPQDLERSGLRIQILLHLLVPREKIFQHLPEMQELVKVWEYHHTGIHRDLADNSTCQQVSWRKNIVMRCSCQIHTTCTTTRWRKHPHHPHVFRALNTNLFELKWSQLHKWEITRELVSFRSS